MKFHNDASDRVVKGIAEVNRILDALHILLHLGLIERADYCSDAVRWMGVKALLQHRITWDREAQFTERTIAKLLDDPVFQPVEDTTCDEVRCFVRPGVEHTHPGPGITVMGDPT